MTPTGSGNGSGWGANATSLANAMQIAKNGNSIWVASGTYIPVNTSPASPNSPTFQLLRGVSVYGGFAGGETTLSQRNVAANHCILSGQLTGSTNAFHVVTGDNFARLDGFEIIAGKAGGSAFDDESGGGLLCVGTTPTIVGCAFTGNCAQLFGGAVFAYTTCAPVFINCVFANNTAVDDGGAVMFYGNVNASVINCTFNGNSSPNGSAIFDYSNSNVTMINSVLWGDTGNLEFYNLSSTPTISFSDIQGGLPAGSTDGGGNINLDPQFINASAAAGVDGFFMNGDDGLIPGGTSPCLSKGTVIAGVTPSADIILNQRPDPNSGSGKMDMGAYETPYVQVQATASSAIKPANSLAPTVFGTFTITRNGSTALPMQVNLSVAGSSASAGALGSGADYVTLPTSVIIAAGSTTATVTVTPIKSSQAENPVTVVLTVLPGQGAPFSPITPNGYAVVPQPPTPANQVTNTNQNTPGVVITPAPGSTYFNGKPNILFTTQTQAPNPTAQFNVVLNSQPIPGATVTVNLVSSNPAEGTISPSSIAFSSANWNTAVPVTVSGVNDYIAHAGPQSYHIQSSISNSTDPFYNDSYTNLTTNSSTTTFSTLIPFMAMSPSGAACTNWVVKVGGATVSPATFTVTSSNPAWPASGSAPTAIVTLGSAPASSVTVNVQYYPEQTFTGSGSNKVFTTLFPAILAKPNGSQTAWVVSVNGVVQTTDLYTVTPASPTYGTNGVVTFTTAPPAGQAVLVQTDIVAAANANLYTKGVTVTLPGNLNVPPGAITPFLSLTEGGATGQYTVALTSQPVGGNVVVTLTPSLANLTTNVSTLTFTPTFNQTVSGTTSGWNVPQTVTVSALRDFTIDTPTVYPGTVAQALSAGSTDYATLLTSQVPNCTVHITDIDAAGVIFTPSSGLTTSTAGTSASFTVQLTSIPAGNVTVTLLSNNIPQGGTISGSNVLTFTHTTNQAVLGSTSGWNVAQTVTVVGANFPGHGSISYLIGSTIASGDPNYGAALNNPAAVSLTNSDTSVPGVIISQTGSLEVTKGQPGQPFGVQLATDPTVTGGGVVGDSVVVSFRSLNGLVSITPSTAVFTGSGPTIFSSPDSLTVTALVSNIVKQQVQNDVIIYSTNSNCPGYNNLSGTLAVHVHDNGVAGVELSPTEGLVTTEAGGSASFQVSLLSQPAGISNALPTTVSLTSSNPGAGILALQFYSTGTTTSGSPASSIISFPAADDLSAVTVNMLVQIGGLGPNQGAVTQVTAVDLVANSVTVVPALVATTATETVSILPAVSVGLGVSSGTQVVTFAGSPNLATLSSAIFEGQTVLIPGTPIGGYSVRYVDAGGSPPSVTLSGTVPAATSTVWFSSGPLNLNWSSAAQWQAVQTATVIGMHNHQVNGNVNYAIAASASSGVGGDPDYQTSATAPTGGAGAKFTFDFPLPYVPYNGGNWTVVQGITPITGFAITNNGGNAHIILPAPISGTVTLNYVDSVTDYPANTGTVFQFPLVYDGTGANWQVYVNGVLQAAAAYTIANYNGVPGNNAQVTLNSTTTGNVTLTYLPGAATASKTTLGTDFDFFVPFVASNGSNWAVSQGGAPYTGNPFTLTNNAGFTHVSFNAAVSGAPITLTYLPTVSLTNLDVDTAGFVVTPLTKATIFATAIGTEDSASYSISLTSEPVQDVSVQVQSSNTAKGIITSGLPLVFTQATPNNGLGWDQPHMVTISAVYSPVADGTVSFTVLPQPASSTDVNYASLVAPGVTLSTVDPNGAALLVTPSPPMNTNAQANQTATFTVMLTSQPLGNVSIPLNSSNTGKGVPTPTSLLFTPANWNVAQPVTVSGVANQIVQGPVVYFIGFGQITAPNDPGYAVLSTAPVQVTGHDNNQAGYVISDPTVISGHVFTFSNTGVATDPLFPLWTTDLGGPRPIQIALTSMPSNNQTVVISLSTTDASLGTPLPATLSFNVNNWNVPQPVTVTGGNSNNLFVDGTYIITASITGTVEYATLAAAQVPFTNVAQIKAPTLDAVANVTVNEVSQAGVIQPAVPLTGITAGINIGLATSTLTPVSPPILSVVSPPVRVPTTTDHLPLFSSMTAAYAPAGTPPGTITFVLSAQEYGSAAVTATVVATDSSTPPAQSPSQIANNPWPGRGGAKSFSQPFTITVNHVNQQPSFTVNPLYPSTNPSYATTLILNEQVGAQVVQQDLPAWATAISVGPANESSQHPTFACANSNPALFSVQPAVDPISGDFTYTLASTAFGSALVTVTLMDDGLTDNGGLNASTPQIVSIVVNAVNQAPTLVLGPNVSIPEVQILPGQPSIPVQTSLPLWATNITAGPPDEASQTVIISCTPDNPGLFAVPPAIDLLGNLTFTATTQTALLPPARGISQVTVLITDSLGASLSQTFLITIYPINPPPVVTMSPLVVPIGAAMPITSAVLSATDIDSSPAANRYPALDPNLAFVLQLPPGNGTLKVFSVAQNAWLTLALPPLQANQTNQFTQQDIIAGNLIYTHNGGTSASDGFAFTVQDETMPANSLVYADGSLPTTATPGSDALGNLPAVPSALQVFTIAINRSNPVVTLLPAGPLAFADQGPAELIAPTATVSDPLASPAPLQSSFTGGVISAGFASGGTAADVIAFSTSGSFSLAGSSLNFNGNLFGTLTTTQGSAGMALTVSDLTDIADTPTVQAFISSLTYQNTAISPSDPYANPVTNHVVQVQVTDTNNDTSQWAPLTIAVTSVPHVPTFTSPAQYITAENVPLSGQVVAVDADGQALTYSLVGIPTLGTVIINSATGAFSFTPVANTTGTGGFTIQVSDGHSETASLPISVIITADNVFEPFITSNPPMDAQQNDTVIYNVAGYSPGTATPAFTVIGLPPGDFTLTVSGQTATLTLLPTATANAGYVTFGILITDAANAVSGFQPVTLLVEPAPAAGG